ncbi:unnamed protein product [Arctogadus glacialis]
MHATRIPAPRCLRNAPQKQDASPSTSHEPTGPECAGDDESGFDICMNQVTTVGKIQAKVVWLQDGSKTVNVYGKPLELKESHVADHTGKIRLPLWAEIIGQVEQEKSYVLENLAVREEGELYLTTTKTTTIRVSEEVLVPESVAMLRLEVKQHKQEQEEEQEVLTTVQGPVCGVKLADQWQCSSCHKWQLAFNLKAINHRCEACGVLQRVGSYVQAANGTVMVNKGDVTLPLTLTSTVLMTYLSQNNLQELLVDVQLVVEHFLEVGVFEIQYNANNVVVVVTTGNV